MADVVISYARDNQATVRQLAEAVGREGYDVWWDDSDASDADAVTDQIVAAKAVVVVWSDAAAASDQVRAEASVARALKKLVQASADDKPPPPPFAAADMISISSWIGTPDHPGWLKIKAALEASCGKPSEETTALPEPESGAEAAAVAAPAAEEATRPPEPMPVPAEPAAPAAEPAAATAAPAPMPEPAAPAVAAAAAAPPPAAGATPPLTTPAKSSNSGLVIAVAAVLLLAVLGGGWWWMQNRAPSAEVAAVPAPAENVAAPQPVGPTQPSTPPIGIPPMAPAADEFTRQAVVQDPSGYAVVRSAPSALGINIGRVNSGESFSTYPQTGEWWRVRTASGAVGYMAQSSIRLRDANAEANAERRARDRAERARRPRVRYVNSENMRAFCQGAGAGTPECRSFRRNSGDRSRPPRQDPDKAPEY